MERQDRQASGGSDHLSAAPAAHHSRRARELWSIAQQRLTAIIRVRDATNDQ